MSGLSNRAVFALSGKGRHLETSSRGRADHEGPNRRYLIGQGSQQGVKTVGIIERQVVVKPGAGISFFSRGEVSQTTKKR